MLPYTVERNGEAIAAFAFLGTAQDFTDILCGDADFGDTIVILCKGELVCGWDGDGEYFRG